MAVANVDDYLYLYYGQLLSIGLPEDLYGRLYQKLYPELVYDAGDVFLLSENAPSGKGTMLCAKSTIPKNSDVFLVDHAWTNDGGSFAKQQLEEMPQLVSRMQNMFGLQQFNDDADSDTEYFESETVISEVCHCSTEQARVALKDHNGSILDTIVGLSLNDPSRKRSQSLVEECTFEEFKKATESCAPEVVWDEISEDYLKKMYECFKNNKNRNAGAAMTPNYSWSDNAEDGLVEVNVALKSNVHKENVKSMLTTTHWRLEVEGMGMLIDGDLYESVVTSESLWAIESPGVLTMYLKKAKTCGQVWMELIKGENQLSPNEIEETMWKRKLQKLVEVNDVLDTMWRFNQTYTIRSVSDKEHCSSSVWYVMDEVGSAIGHSNAPNFACHPLYIFNKKITVNVIWPIKDVEVGEAITRSFITRPCENETAINFDARLSVLTHSLEQLEIKDLEEEMSKKCDNDKLIDDEQKQSIEFAIDPAKVSNVDSVNGSEMKRKKTIFCDFIKWEDLEKMTSALGCTATNDMQIADCILSKSRPKPTDVSEKSLVNYFIGEENLIKKHVLDAIIAKHLGYPLWYSRSYNLLKELPEVISESKRIHYNQLWVLRSDGSNQQDIHPVLTSDILRITRLVEIGLTVASKYVVDAALYHGKCFALSYLLYIRNPTEIYVHKTPYIREAQSKFDLMALLTEYDTTAVFTTKPQKNFDANKSQNFPMFTKAMEEISSKGGLEKTWLDVENQILESLRTLLSAVKASLSSTSGLNSFGLLGVDFLLHRDLSPIFISFNRIPYFANEKVVKDVVSTLLCTDSSKALPSGNAFTKITI